MLLIFTAFSSEKIRTAKSMRSTASTFKITSSLSFLMAFLSWNRKLPVERVIWKRSPKSAVGGTMDEYYGEPQVITKIKENAVTWPTRLPVSTVTASTPLQDVELSPGCP